MTHPTILLTTAALFIWGIVRLVLEGMPDNKKVLADIERILR